MKAADSAMWEGCISAVVKEQRCDRWPKCTDKQMGMLWIFWGSMSCKASNAQVMTSEPLCEARVTSSISKILSLSRVQVLQNWDQREKTNYWTVIGAELNKHGREVKNWMERKDKTGVYFTESMNHNPIISYPATGYQSVQLFLPYCCWYLCTLVFMHPPEHSLLQAEEFQLSNHFCDLLLDSVQASLPELETEAAPLKRQNLALPFAELHKAPACPALQHAEVALNGQY